MIYAVVLAQTHYQMCHADSRHKV